VALGFGRQKSEDVVSLIAAKKYGRAIEILRVQLKKRGASTTVRKQLADVLVMAGKNVEAVSLLLPLADKFAREGFAAKAVSVLKKIQKIDPGRRDVEERLARLIEEKQRQAAVSLPITRPRAPEIGMEEIGFEAPPSGPVDLPATPPAPAPEATDVPAPEIGFGSSAPISTPTPTPPPEPVVQAPPPAPPEAPPIPVAPEDPEPVLVPPPAEASLELNPVQAPLLTEVEPDATIPVSSLTPGGVGEGVFDLGGGSGAEAKAEPDEIEDYDLLYVPEGEEAEEEVEVDLEGLPAADTPGEAMSDGKFADELMSLVDSVFQEIPEMSGSGEAPALEEPPKGGQIVVSPLFRDFSVDEMVAVIQGLKLLSFDRGDVILREGQPGASLYMLTAGRVRAFRKDTNTGKQVGIGDLQEGAFFGEVSILTGQPRTASIVALNSCELLELDRPTLDAIAKTHPHVWDVLREFAGQRSQARG
jgi:hypothetical protein